VNQKIKEKLRVEVLQKTYSEAVKLGAMALFGEKYGDKVRVLKIGDYSLELCGGTHVKSTSDILFFKIISESALGSGMRRIEALAGQAAKVYVVYRAKSLHDEIEEMIRKYRLLQIEKERLGGVKSMETNIFEIEITELESLAKAVDNQDSMNVSKFLEHLCGRFEWLKERVLKTEKEIQELEEKKARADAQNYAAEVREIAGRKVLFKEFKGCGVDLLRTVSDTLQATLKSCVLVLASSGADRASFLVTVTPDLVGAGVSAKILAAKLAEIIGGRSGGKDNKAEGGGKDPGRVQEGFKELERLLGS